MAFDMDVHFASVDLETLGLTPQATSAEIAAAAQREMDDLDAAFGDAHGCTLAEMAEYLTQWVERERRRDSAEGR